MSIELGSQQLPMQNKQATPTEPISNNLGSQQFPISNKRMTQMAPTLANLGSQKMPNPKKRMTQMVSMPKNLVSQQSSLLNKQMSHVEFLPNNLGSPQSSASNKRSAQMEPSPKGQAESSESVRAKLRESLTDSLALVSKQQTEATGNNSQDKSASTLKPGNENPPFADITSTSTAVSSCHIPEESPKDEDSAQKANSSQSSSQVGLANDSEVDAASSMKSDGQDFQFNYVLPDEEVSFSNNFFAKDELLHGNGLCWVSDLEVQTAQSEETHYPKRPKLVHEEADGDGKSQPSTQDLATRIEAELFKLYGGVNKKYKEKARSLLFNLKDRNNPELRERVTTGEIIPERLCSMTAEELASKELSQWRIAKAEELAQMVVLPDSNVDVRRLVKKTHKGEFQVEFEQDDSSSVEVAVEGSSLSQIQTKTYEKETHAASKPIENIISEASIHEKVNSEDRNLQSSLTTLADDGTDLMQGLMADELKDAEFLPPIVSLDEFMESLDAEPPFENLPVDSVTAVLNSDEKGSLDVGSKLETSDHGSLDILHTASDKLEKPEIKYTDLKSDHGEPETSTTVSTPKQDLKPHHIHRESEKSTIAIATKEEHVWEGLLQLNVSSMVTVIGNFKSGDRTSAKDWTSFLDVKGRVRLDLFEKFLQELPMSRNRTIMIVHFCWKEGSPESGRVNLCEVVDSYVADQRVGFAEPAAGVELYLCPPHGKTTEILGTHLSKDHIETLSAINDGLIGIVVWRKAHVTSTISPNSSSHHKHNTRKQHHSVRRQQEKNANTNISKEPPLPLGPPQPSLQPPVDDELTDDIPPGFGPAAAAARVEDDLPEFDFAGGSNSSVSQFSAINPPKGPTNTPPTRPAEQMRELIHKYGRGEITIRGIGVDGVDDDDDIPEWQPQSLNQPVPPPQRQLPPPPPPPPPQQVHNFQHPSLPGQMVNHSQHFPLIQQFHQYPNHQLEQNNSLPMQHMQSVNMMQGQHAINHWQQGTCWPPQLGPHGPPVQGNGLVPNFGGQPSQFAAGQSGVQWRLDVDKGRGF